MNKIEERLHFGDDENHLHDAHKLYCSLCFHKLNNHTYIANQIGSVLCDKCDFSMCSKLTFSQIKDIDDEFIWDLSHQED